MRHIVFWSQSSVSQSCWDGATASWVFTSTVAAIILAPKYIDRKSLARPKLARNYEFSAGKLAKWFVKITVLYEIFPPI